MGRLLIALTGVCLVSCTAAATRPNAPTATVVQAATPTASPTRAESTATPSGPRSPTPAPSPQAKTQPLPTVEATGNAGGAGFLRPVELDLPFQQPLTDEDELRKLVNDIQQLDGVASVSSDGVHLQVEYDSTRVLPMRIRDRLGELGHPAQAGTDVQNPGEASD